METGLAGKIALLTGGAGAIGGAIGHALIAEGATVAIADRDPDAVQSLVAALRAAGGTALGVQADLTREADVATMIETVLQSSGRLDVLVNCLGIFQAVPLESLALEDWQRVLDVNLTGVFLCCKAALPVMRAQRSGRIINIASLAGQVGGLAAGANYSVSKAGVACLTKSVARALGNCGVTVNTINPGPVDSPMVDAWPPGQREIQLERIPLARLGRPEDIANAVVFLASDASALVTGSAVMADGGWTAG